MVGSRNRPEEVDRLLQSLSSEPGVKSRPDLQQRLVRVLGEGLRNAGAHFDSATLVSDDSAALIDSILRDSLETAQNEGADLAARVVAVRLLGTMEQSRVDEALAELLSTRRPLEVQLAALNALAGYGDPNLAGRLLAGWNEAVPEVRTQTIRALLSREPWSITYLRQILSNEVSSAEVDPLQRNLLREHGNATIRELAARAFGGEASSPRRDVIASYRTVLENTGDAEKGEKVFEQNCMGCHRIGTKGHAVGPDLASTASAEPEALLAHILDPHRYVLPNFVQYVVVDVNGLSHTGMISSQTATSMTLKREKGETETILRANIDELKATGRNGRSHRLSGGIAQRGSAGRASARHRHQARACRALRTFAAGDACGHPPRRSG